MSDFAPLGRVAASGLFPENRKVKPKREKSGYEPDIIVLNKEVLGDEPRWESESIIHTTKSGLVTVPGKLSDDLAPRTLNSILKQAQLKEDIQSSEEKKEEEEN